ncbi:MAG TPA: hypothetical protein VMV20_06860 [Chitinophagaceae bacterium]|nr:hypothetical protein [Chitinophagaceae bacterium]
MTRLAGNPLERIPVSTGRYPQRARRYHQHFEPLPLKAGRAVIWARKGMIQERDDHGGGLVP